MLQKRSEGALESHFGFNALQIKALPHSLPSLPLNSAQERSSFVNVPAADSAPGLSLGHCIPGLCPAFLLFPLLNKLQMLISAPWKGR